MHFPSDNIFHEDFALHHIKIISYQIPFTVKGCMLISFITKSSPLVQFQQPNQSLIDPNKQTFITHIDSVEH